VRVDTTAATCATVGLAPDQLTGWTTTARQVTLSADDGAGSSVAAVHYTVDGGGQQAYAGAFTVSGAGQHPVTYWSIDKAGNVEATRTGWVNIASFYAEATGLAPDADSGWRNGDAPVTITAGGIPAPLTVSYKLDGGDWQTVADGTSFTVSGVGRHTVVYYATNGIGDTSLELTGYVNIETTAPVTARGAVPAGWRRTALTVALQPTDADSGVAATLYSIDGGPETSGTSVTVPAPTDHSMDGVHTVSYHSVDKAGNIEATKTFVVRIDTRRPSTKAPYRASVLRYGDAKLRCRIVDKKPCGLYGSVRVVVKKLNGHVALRKSYTHVRTNALVRLKLRCKLARGTYRFFVLAGDAAGNAQSKTGYNKLTVR
jgi:bacillopeptidase F (M6 metalloprotease family)